MRLSTILWFFGPILVSNILLIIFYGHNNILFMNKTTSQEEERKTNILLMNKTTSQEEERKVYIVYMGGLHGRADTMGPTDHLNMLRKVSGSGFAPTFLLRSFQRSFNGFVAMLTEKEAKIMFGLSGVISVFPSETQQLHTTRSWDFMDFPQHVKRATTESDIIVGVFDTGIWPESDSFSDAGFGPPPSKWKGSCQVSSDFTACNNKVIGARYYRADNNFTDEVFVSPRDSDGHGTHVASTVAGNLVNGASLYGLASGTARGGVPLARIAVYKVCWSKGCEDADILAAFDDAIADGVDIISISIGSSIVRDYFVDPKAIGSFNAMKNGILTSISAGNDGPTPASTTNVAPWTLSVAASTIDRKFITNMQLGDSRIYRGVSINKIDMGSSLLPLIDAEDAPNTGQNFTPSTSRYCIGNALDPDLVKNKIVLCHRISDGSTPFYAGAIGAIFADNSPKDNAKSFPLSASHMSDAYGTSIFRYIRTTSNPSANIHMSNEEQDVVAPYVASFSSRGPNPVTQDILKPDLSAPGVYILAAWSMVSPVSPVKGDSRRVPYNIISGTSMACPHASAAAVYVKSFNLNWSPAAIKSALMTTARPMSVSLNNDANFAFGAGHLDPLKALTPGLIYDADVTEYQSLLCGQGYGPFMPDVDCSKISKTVWDFNYPSFALSALPMATIDQTFTRVVTNVGWRKSSYNFVLGSIPDGLTIAITPNVLTFTSLGQKLSFKVTIQGRIQARSMVFTSLTWKDGQHNVRSPIVVYDITWI